MAHPGGAGTQRAGAETAATGGVSSCHHSFVALFACTLLLAAFVALAWASVRQESATADEPLHSTGAYFVSRLDDYRINPEDPPLWERWAAITTPANAIHHVDLRSPELAAVLQNPTLHVSWVGRTLYETPGNAPVTFVNRMRRPMLVVGVALGIVIAWWAWRLAGAVAAVVSLALFCFSPNFLAHAPLVKNDVAITLAAVATAAAVWRAGVRLRPTSAVAAVLLPGVALLTKFSGPLVVISFLLLLATRATLPADWDCFGRAVTTRLGRLAVAGALAVTAALAAFAMIWACYSFRFAPAANGARWDVPFIINELAIAEINAQHPDQVGVWPEQLRQWRPGPMARTVLFMERHRLLPQTWLYGLLFAYSQALVRNCFLCGHYSRVGFRDYFPLAFLFKTPISTQLAIYGALLFWLARLRAAVRRAAPAEPQAVGRRRATVWATCCLAIPFAVLAAACVQSHLDIGLRHLLPVYPFLYVMTGCAAAVAWRRFGRSARLLTTALAAGLAVEVAVAYPNYIPYFNTVCGGARGGVELLGDSNLDWGQDLPRLAQWQREHPNRPLYLAYFGAVDPAVYGIHYRPLPGGTRIYSASAPSPRVFPDKPCVLAVSATVLQHIYITAPATCGIYDYLRKQESPCAVIGGSIYLYEYEPR